MFLQYLKSRARVMLLFLAFALIFALVFSLYELPAEAVLYASLLCAALGGGALSCGYARWRRYCRALERIGSSRAVSLEALPEGGDMRDSLWRAIAERLGAECRRLDAESDAARRDAGDYYALWAHQIKTPIAAMRLLLQQPGEIDRGALMAELFRVEQYVEMVLGYQRLGGDTNDLVFRRRSLDAIVRGCLRKYARLFIIKKLPLDFAETGLTVLTDEKWLAFMIEQLLSNALKYTSRGSIRIYAEGRALVIEDTGIGIAPEDLPRLGERGYTGCNGREDKKSTGLGLYLCRRICAMLGHELRIESTPGSGTRAIIAFGSDSAIYE